MCFGDKTVVMSTYPKTIALHEVGCKFGTQMANSHSNKAETEGVKWFSSDGA